MLVLSRRLDEAVWFPGLKTSVRVLSVKRGIVRLGIDAPSDVKVLREEVPPDTSSLTMAPPAAPQTEPAQLRDRLRNTAVVLGAVQMFWDAGRVDDARQALATARADLQSLRRALEQGDPMPAPAPSTSCHARALLVEDDRNQRELLAGFLRMAGIEVDTAGDGADALEYLHSRPRPDVVLLDMGLPRCDGAAAVRHIRQDPALADLRIFAVSGSAPGEFGVASGPGGVDRWFQKPIDPATLLSDLTQELAVTPCGA